MTKLVEIEVKIADLQVIADTLRTALEAGFDDKISCAKDSCWPIPFVTITQTTR